MSGLDTRKIV